METLSLKALAIKALQGNRPGNIMETSSFQAGKPEEEKFPGFQRAIPDKAATLEEYQVLFEMTTSELGAIYLPGTFEMVRRDFPELAGEIQAGEDQINELWLQARDGAGDMEAFRKAVVRWQTLHQRAIRFYSLIKDSETVTL